MIDWTDPLDAFEQRWAQLTDPYRAIEERINALVDPYRRIEEQMKAITDPFREIERQLVAGTGPFRNMQQHTQVSVEPRRAIGQRVKSVTAPTAQPVAALDTDEQQSSSVEPEARDPKRPPSRTLDVKVRDIVVVNGAIKATLVPAAGSPPQRAELLMRHLLPRKNRDAIIGDLLEEYRTKVLPRHGVIKARRWFWGQAIRSLAPTLGQAVWRFAVFWKFLS